MIIILISVLLAPYIWSFTRTTAIYLYFYFIFVFCETDCAIYLCFLLVLKPDIWFLMRPKVPYIMCLRLVFWVFTRPKLPYVCNTWSAYIQMEKVEEDLTRSKSLREKQSKEFARQLEDVRLRHEKEVQSTLFSLLCSCWLITYILEWSLLVPYLTVKCNLLNWTKRLCYSSWAELLNKR